MASSATSGCRQFRNQQRLTRREMLSVGGALGLGLSLPDFLRLRRDARADGLPATFGSAKSVIFLFLHGGHPQHETWDPKPAAPPEIRGEFGQIPTRLPGLHIGELLPRCAELIDRMTIIRSMAHDNTNHVQACLPAMTGHKHPVSVRSRGDFPPSTTDFPHFGAVLDHVRPGRHLPTWVQLGPTMTRSNGTVLHGQSAGLLGPNHAPFIVDQDFTQKDLRVEAVTPRVGISRLQGRRSLLAELDAQRSRLDAAAARVKDPYYRRAFNLLTSDATRRAFDLSKEPAESSERYPRTHVGRACLLARRLVEAGVPFVNVHWCKRPPQSWDTHSQNFKKMKQSLGPDLDGALSALIVDLQQRGLLDQTLIMPMAEFGRTPKINKNAGRDHWPFVYSLAMAGAGLRRGTVVGESDRLGAYPKSRPYSPAEMAATIYHLLGVPEDTVIHDQENRPHRLVIARPVSDILA